MEVYSELRAMLLTQVIEDRVDIHRTRQEIPAPAERSSWAHVYVV